MQSLNFEILRSKHPELADLGGFAEQYARPDPPSALVKLRAFAEALAGMIYSAFRLPRPYADEFVALLKIAEFEAVVPPAVQNKFHAIRKEGNNAAHGRPISPDTAPWLIEETSQLAKWWAVRTLNAKPEAVPAFQVPPVKPPLPPDIQARLARQDEELQRKVQQLEQLQRQYQEAARQTDRLETLRSEGQQAANLLLISARWPCWNPQRIFKSGLSRLLYTQST